MIKAFGIIFVIDRHFYQIITYFPTNFITISEARKMAEEQLNRAKQMAGEKCSIQ